MDDFSNVTSRRLLVEHNGYDFKFVKQVLDSLHDWIYKIRKLDVALEDCHFALDDFQYLLFFTNLKRINFTFIDFQAIIPETVKHSFIHSNLEEVNFTDDMIEDWSDFSLQFPSTLQNFSLTFPNADFSAINIAESVQHINFQSFSSDNLSNLRYELRDTIPELRLSFIYFQTFEIDELPAGLRILGLESNNLESFVCNEDSRWPVNLQVLFLGYNNLDNDALQLINDVVGWPQNLTNLNLSFNQFNRIDTLSNLSQSLTNLDISNNELHWTSDQPTRFEFPCKLKYLNMWACNLGNIQNVTFPSSLKNLILSGNGIGDTLCRDNWNDLVNLRTLELAGNSILSLDNWILPLNVRKINLRNNTINTLNSTWPLFNDKYNFKVVNLDMSWCRMNSIEINYIPNSLKQLKLCNNVFDLKFVFPSCFKSLYHLDLTKNGLDEVVFEDTNCSQLQSLDLSHNYLEETLYEEIENKLGKVKQRNKSVNSLLEFEW